MAHANLVTILGLLVIIPMSLYEGQVGAGLNFGALVPFLEEDSFIYRILKNIDVFIGWWLCLLSIGLGILYRMTTARVAKVLFSLWAVWILIKAALSPILSQYIPGM